MWWEDAVVYQIYPRSLQDSDGDGVGDLRGVLSRLDHIERLGADAIWLSPIYPSPLVDFGYDVSDYTDVDPRLGTLGDLDALLAGAHARGLRVLLDLIPCHTSIEHPWFREHPDWYVWADDGPPNNWLAAFGGSAWSRDDRTGRWYLHSFFAEQADLDWRNPEVVAAMQDVVRFWIERGVDGFRLDALDRLLKDTALRDDPPASATFPLPLNAEFASLEHRHSANDPELATALRALREAAGDRLLVGEVYLPTARLAPYLEHLDIAFCFELQFAPLARDHIQRVIEAAIATGKAGWVLSNHDFPRLASRVGRERAPIAAMLLLTLPGMAFVYQGDEIGMVDGPLPVPPLDRAGRDGSRTPMQWTSDVNGGFTTGTPWLPAVDPDVCNVAGQVGDRASLLSLYRDLIAVRRTLGPGLGFLDSAETVLAYERGEHVVALNLGPEPAPPPPAAAAGKVLVATDARLAGTDLLPPYGGRVALRG